MKKTLFFAYILVSIFLLGCAKEEVITQKPAKTFFVNSQAVAMNIEIGGRPFNIEYGKDGWSGIASRSWVAYNGVPKYIQHLSNLSKGNGSTESIVFAIEAPMMEIADPNDINGSYTYANLLDFFKKGKQKFKKPGVNGYGFYFNYVVDIKDLTKNFGYLSIAGSQDDSKLEIVKVEETEFAGFKRIFVTYHIDCNIYKEDAARTKDRLVGTIQVSYTHIPF